MDSQFYGTLSIGTTSAGGSLPISESVVKIRGVSDEGKDLEYSLLTDIDGVTEKIKLPTPSVIYSKTPNSKTLPYALYDVVVTARDFYEKHIYNVAVFQGIDTFLPVNMIPNSIHLGDAPFPSEELDTFVKENEKL